MQPGVQLKIDITLQMKICRSPRTKEYTRTYSALTTKIWHSQKRFAGHTSADCRAIIEPSPCNKPPLSHYVIDSLSIKPLHTWEHLLPYMHIRSTDVIVFQLMELKLIKEKHSIANGLLVTRTKPNQWNICNY